MTSPVIASTGSSAQATAVTSHTMTMPASIAAGNLLVAIFEDRSGTNGASVSGWPAGWVVFPRGLGSSTLANLGCQVAYKFAVGGETSFTLTTSTARTSNSRCFRITGHAGAARPPLVQDKFSGGGATVTPAVTPWEWKQPQDILSIIAVGWENQTTTPTPSGYANNFNSAGLRVETRSISAFSGTEDPANYTTGSGARHLWTILIPSDSDDPDFTYPIVRNWFGSAKGTGTVSVVLPLQREVGDVLVVAIGLVLNVTISSGLPSGWTTEVSVVGGGAGGERMYVLWKRCDGTETNFSLAMSGSSGWNELTCAVLNVSDASDVLSATAASGTANSNPDPPNLSADASLWCAVQQHEARTVTAYPANYTHRQAAYDDPFPAIASIALAFRQLTATSENPGAFTADSSNFWTAATLAFGKANPRYFSAQWISDA